MKVVITGGCGFLGALLSRELLRQGALSLSGRGPQALHQITLLDRVAPVAAIAADLLECSLSTGKMRSSYTSTSCPGWQCAADIRAPLL